MKRIVLFVIFCFVFNLTFSQKSVAIYWDASYSMKNRNLDRELTFLNNYFKKNTEVVVELTMFSNDILHKETFKIENANWQLLKAELEKSVYDGSTAYSVLFKDRVDEYLVFTDGIENIETFKPPTDKPIYVITSLENINATNLKLQAELSSGSLIRLNTNISPKASITAELISDVDDLYITGEVTGYEGNLQNVSVFNQSTGKGVASDTKGYYKIEANKGDIIVYTFLGKKNVSIRVDKTNVVNVTMIDANDSLDEVVVNAKVEKEELINTGNTKVDKRRLGYDVQSISAEDINDQDLNMSSAVNGKFANLTVANKLNHKMDLSQFFGRGKNMTILGNQFGLVVIDGVPLAGSDSSGGSMQGAGLAASPTNAYTSQTDNMIDPSMIESVTYLKGLAATNKYGTSGVNGVLLITTKNATIDPDQRKKGITLGTTATYSGNAETINKLANVSYIKALQKATNIEEAISRYFTQQNQHGEQPIFYLDAFDYFLGWNNTVISNRVLSNVYEIAYSDVKILKAMAYKQQAASDFSGAVKTYQQILKLEPGQSQSYRDLALAYVYSGEFQKAIKIYDDLDKNLRVNNVVKNGIYKTLNIETKNLVALHKDKINTAIINDKFKKPVLYESRIVVEWNDLDAEFDLNIINPQNRVWTWSHTQAELSARILQEKKEGFALEENQLYATDKGEWKFNVKYYGKTSKDKTPTFLKITTYKNYGKQNQSKKIEVFRLDKKNVEQTATKVMIH